MGITQVTAAVCNPGDPERRWEGLFLVDTGAIDCLVPGNRLREIGNVAGRQRCGRQHSIRCNRSRGY